MRTALAILGVSVDLSDVQSDGMRWIGNISFTLGESVVRGRWVGVSGSDMGALYDVEGEDESLCQFIDAHAGEIESVVMDYLGDPCDEDGRRERAAAMAIEAEIDEILIGRAA